MESSTSLNFFDRVVKTTQHMRDEATRSQLKAIEENQRAAVLVRLFEQGHVMKVLRLAAAG